MTTAEILHKTVAAALAATEPATTYSLDCFVTSEVGHNEVITRCRPLRPGGAYLGVGPCQNFSYIGALRPSHAVIVDARIDNLLEHLIFKLIFERADTPADYLSLLFSRPLATGTAADAGSLLAAFDSAAAPPGLFTANCRALLGELEQRFEVPGALMDRARRIYTEFHHRGLSITSVSEQLLASLDYIPDLRTVIASTGCNGASLHFLTSQERYGYVRDLQRADRVVPLLGNITDPVAADSVNGLLADFQTDVTTIYLSNMEEFLLDRYEITSVGVTSRRNPAGRLTGQWAADYDRLVTGLRTLDTAPDCLLIRFFFPGEDDVFSHGVFPWLDGHLTLLRNFLRRYDTERPSTVLDTYW
jgi:hypothetical protein